MKAEKTRRFIQNAIRVADMVYDTSSLDKELAELEAKAAELDRRENGVAVIVTEEYDYHLQESDEKYQCGNCESYEFPGQVYCSVCGTKLIWDNPIEKDWECQITEKYGK